jgi:hypothetical protein
MRRISRDPTYFVGRFNPETKLLTICVREVSLEDAVVIAGYNGAHDLEEAEDLLRHGAEFSCRISNVCIWLCMG